MNKNLSPDIIIASTQYFSLSSTWSIFTHKETRDYSLRIFNVTEYSSCKKLNSVVTFSAKVPKVLNNSSIGEILKNWVILLNSGVYIIAHHLIDSLLSSSSPSPTPLEVVWFKNIDGSGTSSGTTESFCRFASSSWAFLLVKSSIISSWVGIGQFYHSWDMISERDGLSIWSYENKYKSNSLKLFEISI